MVLSVVFGILNCADSDFLQKAPLELNVLNLQQELRLLDDGVPIRPVDYFCFKGAR